MALMLLAASAWGDQPPTIEGIAISPYPAQGGETVQVVCFAEDPEGGDLTHFWATADGSLDGEGDLDPWVEWTLPPGNGNSMITVTIQDAAGHTTLGETVVSVGPIRPYQTISNGVRQPTRIATASDGTLWVTDASAAKVTHLSAVGNLIGEFTTAPRPLGIAIARDGNILVGEDSHDRVSRYSPGGSLLGTLGTGAGAVGMPSAIAVDSLTGRIHVVDSTANAVVIFSDTGSRISSYGQGGLDFPTDIAIDSDAREIFVADQGNSRVVVYDPLGNRLRTLGIQGYLPGQFTRIQSLALEAGGRLAVLDSFQNSVQLLELSGAHVATFGYLGTWPGALRTPLGLGVIPNERIFVGSEGTGNLEVFAHWAWSESIPLPEGQGVIFR